MKEPINKITLKDGTVRYRLVVDIGRDEHGRRKQLTRTFDTRREAREELSRIRHETHQGTYVKSSKETLNSYLDGYLQGATRGLRASTKRNYEDALRPVRERLGIRPLQSVTKSDVEDLVDWMLTAGRRRGEAGNGPVRSFGTADAGPVQRRTGGGRPRGQARPQRGTTCQTARAHPAGARDLEQGGSQEIPSQGVI